MSRQTLYPEGRASITALVPATVKEALEKMADRERRSLSQTVTIALEDYLSRQPTPEAEKVPA